MRLKVSAMSRPPPPAERPLPQIAIVEDDTALRDAIAFSLTAEGYSVRLFEAAEELRAEKALDDIACFVIDQKLPGMAGLPLIQELSRRGDAARCVLITTRPEAAVREACWALGVPIVEKPILGESLNACIRGLLARPMS